jgi:hypothetical protein
MKYALFVSADQTIVYLADGNSWTTKHPEALLFESRMAAQAAVDAVRVAEAANALTRPAPANYDREKESQRKLVMVDSGPDAGPPDGVAWSDVLFLEEVLDEAEFRRREDTW